MNYKKLQDQIIKKARVEGRKKREGVYYEEHHIQPQCMGGNDEDKNLVLLTAREHFLIHWILTKIYPNEPKLIYAFNGFSQTNCGRRGGRSWLYKYAREKYIQLLIHNEEWKRKMAKSMSKLIWIKNEETENCLRVCVESIADFEKMGYKKGRIIKHRTPHSTETRKKMSLARDGMKLSKIHVTRISEKLKNRTWINNGNDSKMIDKKNLDLFIKSGWNIGRGKNWNNPFAR